MARRTSLSVSVDFRQLSQLWHSDVNALERGPKKSNPNLQIHESKKSKTLYQVRCSERCSRTLILIYRCRSCISLSRRRTNARAACCHERSDTSTGNRGGIGLAISIVQHIQSAIAIPIHLPSQSADVSQFTNCVQVPYAKLPFSSFEIVTSLTNSEGLYRFKSDNS